MLQLLTLTASLLSAMSPLQEELATGDPPKRFTLEDTLGRGPLYVPTPSVSWQGDGSHYAWGGELYATESGERSGAVPDREDPVLTQLASVLELVDEEGRPTSAALRRKQASDGEQVVLASHEQALYIVRGDFTRRMQAAEAGELHELSPDGRWLAWHADGNLFVADTIGADVRALTTDGNAKLLHGKLDWVYQEEVYGRGKFKGFWWSPDSSRIAFLRLDESPVHDFTVIDHLHPDGSMRVHPEITSYPKVGDPNPIAELCVSTLATGEYLLAELGDDPQKLLVRVSWSPAGERVLVQVQNRIQNRLDLVAVDPESGAAQTWISETSDSWVNVLGLPRWLESGDFLWESERSGQRHVYRYGHDGSLLGAVTAGDWDVLDIAHIDESSQRLWFVTNKDSALDRQGYVIGLDGSGLTRLTQGSGQHRIDVSASGWFIDSYSSLNEPPSARICKPSGQPVRQLEGPSSSTGLDTLPLSSWQLVTIPTRDGYELDGALLQPVDFDPRRSYPVWIPTYSGPDAPSVSNRWNSSAWFQFLAQNDVCVLQVNVRSASRKGQAVTASCYKRLGVQELADLEDAVDWLCAKPWADARRVGITGWSYGGFMSAYAVLKSDRFALAIAGAGVYDWRLYDSIYTERYMQTPELNPEGYAQTSVIEAAKNAQSLGGHLVLLHGTMDDNVHFQNTVQLVHALQKSSLDFELMLYPESRHGVRDRDLIAHRRRLEWRAIEAHLLAPGEDS